MTLTQYTQKSRNVRNFLTVEATGASHCSCH